MTFALDEIPGEWVHAAACSIDCAEDFFRGGTGEPMHEPSSAYAKAMCARCPVRRECLAWVLEDDKRRMERRERVNDGVWGGLTRRERELMRRRAQ